MYRPKPFQENNRDRLLDFIRSYNFGMLLTQNGKQPFVSHLPFLLHDSNTLRGHLARPNPQVEQLIKDEDVMVIFQGPHAYISPAWYEGSGVPTWNYATVHIHGKPRLLDDTNIVREIVDKLTQQHEANTAMPWQPDYPDTMLQAIVGFEIEINDIEGKFKLSQNRSVTDQHKVIESLKTANEPIANLMEVVLSQNKH